MKRVCQIDGGDIRGIMPLAVCVAIEEATGKKMRDLFDLVIGASTGAVVGGALSCGVPAKRLLDIYINDLVPGFTSRKKPWKPWSWFKPSFSRESFMKLLYKELGHTKMGDLPIEYIATAYNRCSNRTHFISSEDDQDKNLEVVEVISWSALSAAWFFGAIKAPNYEWKQISPDGNGIVRKGAVFQDGGQGINNNTVAATLIESLCHDWDSREGLAILSLGTGSADMYSSYKKEAKKGYFSEVIDFPFQARNESTVLQVGAGYKVSRKRKGVYFRRLDATLSEKQMKFGDTKNIPMLKKVGAELAKKVPYKELGIS